MKASYSQKGRKNYGVGSRMEYNEKEVKTNINGKRIMFIKRFDANISTDVV